MSTDLNAINAFMQKAKSAARTGSKELRMTVAEANELVAAVAEVLAINVQVSKQLRDTEKLIGASVVIDGGRLGS